MKELSKITMPVIFNEPLSFIQRLCEYMEYSKLLEAANKTTDSLERIQVRDLVRCDRILHSLCSWALEGEGGRPMSPWILKFKIFVLTFLVENTENLLVSIW